MFRALLVILLATSINEGSSSSNATCNSTYCLTSGEASNTYTVHTQIAAFLENQSQSSVNATREVLVSVKDFISYAKLDLTSTLFLVYGPSFQNYRSIFDEFYEYMFTAVKTRGTCRLYELFQRMLYKVYTSAYANTGGQINTAQFNQCSYEYFTESNSQFVNTSYSSFATSFNKLVLFMRAMRVSSVVLDSVSSSPLTKPCVAALAKISNCSVCLGVPVEAAPCSGLCTNILRGCLVDMAELVEPFQDYLSTLVDFKNRMLTDYNPWNQIVYIESNIIKFISSLVTNPGGFTELTRRCNADALSGKRNVPVLSLGISKRAVTVATPTRVINDSILHVVGIPQLLTSLSELVCTSVHAVRDSRNCWNGMGMGRYSHVIIGAGGKSQQINNPEVVFCPSSGAQYQRQISLLKRVTQDLKLSLGIVTCHQDDEDCVGTTSITGSSCADPYNLPSISNITRRAVPEHYDQGGSGSGSGSGFGPDIVPMDYSVCDVEASSTPATTSVPPTTDCYIPADPEAPSSEVVIKQSMLMFTVCVWSLYLSL